MKMCGSQKSFNEAKPVQYFDLVSTFRTTQTVHGHYFPNPGLQLVCHSLCTANCKK